MNIITVDGICNSTCLQASYEDQGETNAQAFEFVTKIMETGLRWGGTFTEKDPVHIDDDLGSNDYLWMSYYSNLQPNCYDLRFTDEDWSSSSEKKKAQILGFVGLVITFFV